MSDIAQAALNKASADKFLLVLNVPPALMRIDNATEIKSGLVNNDALQFSVFGAVVPEINVPALEIRYSGSTLFVSSHSKDSFPPSEVKYTIDNKFKNYWVIASWLNLLHDQETGLYNARELAEEADYTQYQADISIFGLDEYGKRVIEWKYTKAFPVTQGGITYSDRDPNELESMFKFAFSQLHIRLIEDDETNGECQF